MLTAAENAWQRSADDQEVQIGDMHQICNGNEIARQTFG